MRLQGFYILAIAGLLAGPTFDPEDYLQREITARRLEKPLKIDGQLTEPLYQTPPIETFIQLEPDNGQPASEETQVWIGYDDGALYVGARLWESQPDSIVGRMGRRDVETSSDQFQLVIDSYHDKRSGFFFLINPSGTISDGTVSNDSWFDDTWDGVWFGKTSIDDQGWSAEMRIPFSQLRFNDQEEYVWGIGLGRWIQRKNEHALITYLKRGESGIVSHFATLVGIVHIDPPKRVEFIPYFTSGYSRLPSQKENPFFQGKDSNLGVGTDFKIGIGNNLTVDATLNPDFGQVEVDPSVINLTAFETYYEEKRPFFVEGASLFSFGSGGPTSRWGFNFSEPEFFYSRRIGRPPQGEASAPDWVDRPNATAILGAAKISGKLPGNWSIAGLSALTSQEYARIDSGGVRWKEKIEPLTSYNLFRTQKEFNQGRQGLGLLGTYVGRNYDDLSLKANLWPPALSYSAQPGSETQSLKALLSHSALSLGVDGWIFLDAEKDWVIAGWTGLTRITGSRAHLLNLQENSSHYFQRPDADHVTLDSSLTRLSGYAGRLILNKEKGQLTLNAALGLISPGFESNDLGLNFGTDRINKHIVVGYKWYDPGEVFRYAAINTAYMTNHNFGGIKTDENVFLFGYAQLLNYWAFNGFMGWEPRTISDTKLRGGPRVVSPSTSFWNLNVNSDNRKNIVFGLGGRGGGSEKGGRWGGPRGWMEIKLGTRLNLEISSHYSVRRTIDQYLDRISDDQAPLYGSRYVVAQIDQKTLSTDLRIDYTFTPTLSLQAYFQPFIASGAYSRFKEFVAPETYDFLIYGEGGSTIVPEGDGYRIDPTGGDEGDAFSLDNPDFNYKALVGNVVLRWEFQPGSTLYLVWTSNGYDEQNPGNFLLNRDLNNLFQATTDNVLALKITYWLGT